MLKIQQKGKTPDEKAIEILNEAMALVAILEPIVNYHIEKTLYEKEMVYQIDVQLQHETIILRIPVIEVHRLKFHEVTRMIVEAFGWQKVED